MRIKTVFTVNSVYAFLFGAGFILFPNLCSSLIGFESGGDSFLIARALGIFVLFKALLTLLVRNAEESDARRAVVLSLMTLYTLLILYKLALNLVYGIPFTVMLALIYVLHVGFVTGYGYSLVGKPPATA
ncbi:MAG: hypothetical protein R6V57_20150 [Vicinamibacterales bacterium]